MRFTRLACPEWESLATQIANIEPAKKSEFLYAGCKYERFELLTQSEFDASWKASGLSLLAVPMYAWLVDNTMEPAEAKRLTRSMVLGEEVEEAPGPSDTPHAQ